MPYEINETNIAMIMLDGSFQGIITPNAPMITHIFADDSIIFLLANEKNATALVHFA